MLAQTLAIVFVSAFIALAVLGHVLVLLAVWPGRQPGKRVPQKHEPDAENGGIGPPLIAAKNITA